jgi:hypothetical protein
MGRQWLVLGEKSKKSGARGKGSEDEDEGELAKHSCARLLQPLPTLGSLFSEQSRTEAFVTPIWKNLCKILKCTDAVPRLPSSSTLNIPA